MKNIIKNIKIENNILWLSILKDEKISREKYILDKNFFQNKIVQKIMELDMKNEKFFPCYIDDRKVILIAGNLLSNQTAEFINKKLKIKTVCYFAEEDDYQKTVEIFSKILKNKNSEQIKEIFKELQSTGISEKRKGEDDIYNSLSGENPAVIKAVNALIFQGVEKEASDIHIEPHKEYIRTRYRIDGILIEAEKLGINFLSAIISRIKIMAEMDIVERRMPQDGRFKAVVNNREIDFRVSIIPTITGEKCVIRILNKDSINFDLGSLGLEEIDYKKAISLLEKQNGMLLISGPTGSGKSSTLYSILKKLNTGKENISTVEDPVEYEIEGINQVQCKNEIGRTFASVLRAYLRQDPDILMVGEIRDKETAEIAIKAAVTGHMLLSTIHTSDSIGGINRLLNIGIQPYMIAASLTGIISQRLVRKICPYCCEKDEKWIEKIQLLGYNPKDYEEMEFFTEKGCPHCNNTGYQGRTAIFEIFILDEEIKNMINKNCSAIEIEKIALSKGMRKLAEDGIEKAGRKITSLNEILRQC